MSKVVLIEDSLRRSTLARNIANAGYEVLPAGDYEEGIALIAQEAPPCVVLDLDFPEGEGLDILEQLHKSRCRSAVVVVTGDTSDAMHRQCARFGVHSVVYKPIQARQLDEAVYDALVAYERVAH